MAQNITIAGASYSDVPAIDVPKTDGGTARFYDASGDMALTPSLSEQSVDVKSYATASVAAITKELLAALDSDFVAENIKKDVDLFGLLGTMEGGGGGSSWTDVYSVFATGNFTPTENATEWSIDTGVLFDSSNYLSQFLIIWRESDMTSVTGFYLGAIRALTKSNSGTHMGIVVGSNAGANVASPLKDSNSSYPIDGNTIWTITGLSSSLQFRAGKTYRWILLGALK